MSAPSTPAIRSRLSRHTALTVLIQLAAFFALSGCTLPGPAIEQVPTVTLALHTIGPATEQAARDLYQPLP